MKQNGAIKGYTKAIWNGVTTIELSRAIVSAIQQDLRGVYHLVTNESIDKFHLLELLKSEFDRKNVAIEPFSGFSADKSLVNTRSDFIFSVKSYANQISEMKDWINIHKTLYWYK
jgi:dTDP-4-dehydrorhamnose reductase